MNQKKYLKGTLITGLFLISLGGWFLHVRIHPTTESNANYVPFILGIISFLIIPLLFLSYKTIQYGYILNGMIVIIGTIVMAHFSLTKLPNPLSLRTFFLNTTIPDILILWVKFVLGKAIFDLELYPLEKERPKRIKYFRYPNMGWWWIHLIALSLVYYLGNVVWR